MIDTSQYPSNGMAEHVEKLLPDFGYAIDVGANDGLFLSNSLRLEQKGWLVLCVEPNPLLSDTGRKNRKLWVEAACGREDVTNVQFDIVGEFPYASVSGFHVSESPEEMFPPGNNGKKIMSELVTVVTLNTLLYHCGFNRLDFLTIDTEGHEMEVLKGICLWKWKPKVIVAEAWTEEARHKLTEYLHQYRYDLDTVLEYDCCYVLK